MLSEEKIRMMIRLSDYEQEQGKNDLYRAGFFRSDFLRLQVLKTILCVTLASVLIIFLYAAYDLEYLMTHATEINFVSLGQKVLILYVLLVALFSSITVAVSAKKYDESRKRTKIYYRTLTNLVDYYDQEEDEKEDIEE